MTDTNVIQQDEQRFISHCSLLFLPPVQIFLYDGKSGEKLGTLGGEKAHDGGIYAVSVGQCDA